MVEQLIRNQQVAGSSPVGGSQEDDFTGNHPFSFLFPASNFISLTY